jgi:AraC-like DNA-binding protein
MITKADTKKLSSLVEAFYNLTGIKVAVYDKNLSKIFSYPEKDSPLCLMIQSNKASSHLCAESTEGLCKRCAERCSTLTFRCHAGLTEVVTPLTDGREVIGYVMFGQISDEPNKEFFIKRVLENCKKYRIDDALLTEEAKKIPYYSNEKIEDAAKILTALAGYIVYENIVYPAASEAAQKILDHIKKNLGKDLSVDHLCREFYISKSELYKLISPYAKGGIAKYVKEERIKAAAELLRKTDMSALEIASEVGFCDVNYFLRVFKKEIGESAANYRKRSAKL